MHEAFSLEFVCTLALALPIVPLAPGVISVNIRRVPPSGLRGERENIGVCLSIRLCRG